MRNHHQVIYTKGFSRFPELVFLLFIYNRPGLFPVFRSYLRMRYDPQINFCLFYFVYAVSRNFDGNGRCSRKQRGQRGQPGGVHSTYRINRGDYSLFLKLSKEIKWSVIDYVKPDLCMAGYVCRPVC